MKNSDGFNDYDFGIGEVISNAYKHINGVKGTFVASFLIFILISFIAGLILAFIAVLINPDLLANKATEQILQIIIAIFTMPMFVGIQMLALNHVRGNDINFKNIFNYYDKTLKLFLAVICVAIIAYIPLVIFVILGMVAKMPIIMIFGIFITLYLAMSYYYVYQLIVDKDLDIWEAMELSRKTVTKHFFKFFGLVLVSIIILMISIIPLGIGLIWSTPLILIALNGLLYQKMFD